MRGFFLLLSVLAACGQPAGSATGSSAVVARVGDTEITQHQLDIRYRSTLSALAAGGAPTQNPQMESRLRASVVRGLIYDAVIANEAKFQHLSPTDADLEAEFKRAQADAGGAAPLETQLAAAGGSDESLRDGIRARLTEQRLEDFEARGRAQFVLSQIDSGASLESLASQYSDAVETQGKGGLLGSLTDDQIRVQLGDAAGPAIAALAPGQHTGKAVRTAAGYEILQVDAVSPAGRTVREILVAAPDPYTVRERPPWFSQQVFQAILDDCHNHKIEVTISDPGANPCDGGNPPPLPSGTPAASHRP